MSERYCSLEPFRQVEIAPTAHVTLTEHGFDKKHGEGATVDEIERARGLVLERLRGG